MSYAYTVKNQTAFMYFWLLKQDTAKNQQKLKKDIIEDKDVKSINEWIECLKVLGQLAFGEKEFNEMITGENNGKNSFKPIGTKKSKENEAK